MNWRLLNLSLVYIPYVSTSPISFENMSQHCSPNRFSPILGIFQYGFFFSFMYSFLEARYILLYKNTADYDACYVSKVLWFVLFGLVWQYSTNQNQYDKGRFKVMAPSDLQLPLRQWSAGNVFLLVLAKR